MNYLIPFLLGLAITIGFLWLARRRDGDDAAAGIELNSEFRVPHSELSAAWPAKHFLSACMYCHRVTRTDNPAHPIRIGDDLRVSHGICPACMAAKHPEVAQAELQPA